MKVQEFTPVQEYKEIKYRSKDTYCINYLSEQHWTQNRPGVFKIHCKGAEWLDFFFHQAGAKPKPNCLSKWNHAAFMAGRFSATEQEEKNNWSCNDVLVHCVMSENE